MINITIMSAFDGIHTANYKTLSCCFLWYQSHTLKGSTIDTYGSFSSQTSESLSSDSSSYFNMSPLPLNAPIAIKMDMKNYLPWRAQFLAALHNIT